MTKKEYVTMFLEKVKDIREPARGFLVLLRYGIFNEEQVDELFKVFKDVVKSSVDEQKKRKLERAISATEELRKKEASASSVEEDLDRILQEV